MQQQAYSRAPQMPNRTQAYGGSGYGFEFLWAAGDGVMAGVMAGLMGERRRLIGR